MNKVQSVQFEGPAGRLEGLLKFREGIDPLALVVICHPHPLYQGTMHNKVVFAMAEAFCGLGCAVLRFNFRGGRAQRGKPRLRKGRAAGCFGCRGSLAPAPRRNGLPRRWFFVWGGNRAPGSFVRCFTRLGNGGCTVVQGFRPGCPVVTLDSQTVSPGDVRYCLPAGRPAKALSRIPFTQVGRLDRRRRSLLCRPHRSLEIRDSRTTPICGPLAQVPQLGRDED